MKFQYKGVVYDSKRDLRHATKLSGCKIKAKIQDQEIKLIKE